MINGLCAKNGTQRENTCKLQLSLQPRFIARFNQLVSQTTQTWEASKTRSGAPEDEEHGVVVEEESPHEQEVVEHEHQHEEDHEDSHPEDVYEEEYEGVETAEEIHEFDQDVGGAPDATVLSVSVSDIVDVVEEPGDSLTAAEEDELYEENSEQEEFDPSIQSAESVVNEMDDRDDDTVEHQQEYHEEYQEEYHEGEEEGQEAVTTTDIPQPSEEIPAERGMDYYHDWFLTRSDSEKGNADEDDLISYEEAVDQTEDGQDYRQQFINEDNSVLQEQPPTEPVNGHTVEETQTIHEVAPPTADVPVPEEPDTSSSPGSPTSKRSFGETLETAAEDQAPRKHPRY